MQIIKIYFDGYSSPHKHNRAGYCVIIKYPSGGEYIESVPLSPDTTNNASEAEGLLRALEVARDKTPPAVKKLILGDSRLIIEAFRGRLRLRNTTLACVIERCWEIRREIPGILHVKWIPREQNLAGKYVEDNHKNV